MNCAVTLGLATCGASLLVPQAAPPCAWFVRQLISYAATAFEGVRESQALCSTRKMHMFDMKCMYALFSDWAAQPHCTAPTVHLRLPLHSLICIGALGALGPFYLRPFTLEPL